MKTRRHYTSPVTRRATVELEGGFCGSIYETTGGVKVEGHEKGDTYTFDADGVGGTKTGTRTEDGFSISWD